MNAASVPALTRRSGIKLNARLRLLHALVALLSLGRAMTSHARWARSSHEPQNHASLLLPTFCESQFPRLFAIAGRPSAWFQCKPDGFSSSLKSCIGFTNATIQESFRAGRHFEIFIRIFPAASLAFEQSRASRAFTNTSTCTSSATMRSAPPGRFRV